MADLLLDLLADLPLRYWHLMVKMSSNLADLPQICWQINPPILISHGQDEFKFGRSTPRSTGRSTTWYLHLVVKMRTNLADLPLDLLTFQSLPVLTSCGQEELKFSRSTPWYWHLMVKVSSNLADLPLDLLTDLPPVLTSCGQDEFKFGRSTPVVLTSHRQDGFKFGRCNLRSAGRSNPLVLTSQDQGDFKFGRSIPKSVGRSTPQYWHLVAKMSSYLQIYP